MHMVSPHGSQAQAFAVTKREAMKPYHMRRYRESHRAQIRADHRKWTRANRERLWERRREWNRRNPAKIRCYEAVRRALKSGKLVRPHKCGKCGKHLRVLAHHEDYAAPLKVDWLCTRCHSIRHGLPVYASRRAS